MDEQTRKLLEECSIGCEMGADSMKQIRPYIRDENLKELTDRYIERHEELQSEAAAMLSDGGFEPREPGTAASAFSWFTTELKLTFSDDNHQIAKLLIDGCNMGIKTLSEHLNTLNQADRKASALTQKILKAEETLMKEARAYL